jgi:hypothetical protein
VHFNSFCIFYSSQDYDKGILSYGYPKNKSPFLGVTIDEASELSNIGINRIDAMLLKPNSPFVLFVGKKELVKRKEFEAFISKSLYI